MKKVVLASLLAVAGVAPLAQTCFAQAAPAAGGQINMSADEYKAYNDCSSASDKAMACEAYLKAFPNSPVKADVLQILLYAYSQANNTASTLDAADRLLQLDPNNLRALTFEVYFRRQSGDALTDPAAKQAALDKVAAYAQTGLNATKPANTSDDDFNKLKAQATPTFQSAIADDDLAKKDYAGATSILKTEIDANADATKVPGPVLQDVYYLAQAYYNSAPPDYLNCAWYGARAAAFAPEPYKTTINQLGTYCYSKYHGSKDGYATLQAAVQTSLDPPANLSTTITPAPKPADIIQQLIASTPDLSVLAVGDREFVLQYGNQPDPKCTPTADAPCVTNADKAFNSVKGKSVQFPDVLVVSATTDKINVAVSDDAIQGKTADFEFDLKTPLTEAKIPAAGTKVTLTGTYASYTSSPLLITMSDSEVVEKKKPAAPVHHPAPARRRP